MIRYHSQKQLPLADFEWPFQVALDEQNHWVTLSQCVPWDELAEGYYRSFSVDQGRHLKQFGIHFAGKPLGRPRQVTEANRDELKRLKAQRQADYLQRIPIEDKFGQGKNRYRLDYIWAKRRHLECLDQQHLPGNEPDHPVEGLFALWIKVAYQPLARFTARVLLRYRFTGLCFRLPGVVRDENAILT